MISLTTHRYNVIKDDNLPLETKKACLSLLDEKIGYPAPDSLLDEMMDQADDESPIAKNIQEVRDYNFIESWHRGAGYSSAKQEWKGVTFHHTSGTILGTIDHLTKRTKGASYHCMIGEDGNRYRFVDDNKRAYHAGFGIIHGRNPNHVCLGISFNGDTVSGRFRKTRKLNKIEIASTIEFLTPRWEKFEDFWKWTNDHRTVDPNRRDDLAPDVLDQLLTAIEKEFGR